MVRRSMVWAQAIGLLMGGVLVVIGALLPWVDNNFNNPRGVEYGEGQITLALGLVLVGLAAIRLVGQGYVAGALVTFLGGSLSATVLMLALREQAEINALRDVLGFLPVQLGPGLPVTLAGGSL